MALKPLEPAVKEALGNGWELLASEAGRSPHGLQATVTLLNGTAQACQTVALGDPAAQHALTTAFAEIAGLADAEVTKALMQLAGAVEGILRQMDAQRHASADSQATRLVTLAIEAGVELFHTPEGEPYASILVEGHTEHWQLKVRSFRRWLARLFYEAYDKTPGSQAVQDALGVLEGKALYDGTEWPVYMRLAEYQGAIYLDLGNAAWQAVEISANGWRVIDTPPVKFRRAKGLLALPVPVVGGSLADLRPFVNLASKDDWCLVVSWLIATFRPTGPYPVLVMYGEQGSGKSSLVRVLRAQIDPNAAALRTTPRDERDLIIAATNGWLIALDNLSHLPEWLSDALCRLATGSGFATRELYTDADETIFAAQRPIVLNGIEEVATRGDLLDRAITLYLPTIPADQRQDEQVFWQAFEQARPQILGALLDIVSSALQHLPHTTLSSKPRMADFALWACAAADACGWTAQDFVHAYQGVREALHELTLEASPVGALVRDFAQQHSPWAGTASGLLAALETLAQGRLTTGDTTTQAPQAGKGVTMPVPKASSDVTKHKGWPKDGRVLSNILRRLAPTLRAVGVSVTFDRAPDKQRRRIVRLEQSTPPPSPEHQTPGGESEADERDQEMF
jgi:hypothetical protein